MNSYKLLPVGGEWILNKSGTSETLGRFLDKEEALREGLRLAHSDGSSLVMDPPPRTMRRSYGGNQMDAR